MSKNSAVSTGVLRFSDGVKMTLVIRALFAPFALDGDDPAHEPDLAYIARDQDEEVNWGVIRDNLRDECNLLGLTLEDGADPEDLTEYIYALADHLVIGDADFGLQNLLENVSFNDESDADLQILFELATHLDDGHGLQGIQMEGAYYSDRKDLGEFGGTFEFVTRDVYAHGAVSKLVTHADDLNDALTGWTPDAAQEKARSAAEQIAKAVAEQLSCITDPDKRAAVAAHLPKAAAAEALKFSAPAVDDDLNVTEFGVNVGLANGCGEFNPFDENFGTQSLAEEAAKAYLREPGCEQEKAVVFRLVIEKNTIVESTELTWFDRDELLATKYGVQVAGNGEAFNLPETHADQAAAEQAAKDYLLDPSCEENWAVIFMQTIVEGQVADSKELTTIMRDDLIDAPAPR